MNPDIWDLESEGVWESGNRVICVTARFCHGGLKPAARVSNTGIVGAAGCSRLAAVTGDARSPDFQMP